MVKELKVSILFSFYQFAYLYVDCDSIGVKTYTFEALLLDLASLHKIPSCNSLEIFDNPCQDKLQR